MVGGGGGIAQRSPSLPSSGAPLANGVTPRRPRAFANRPGQPVLPSLRVVPMGAVSRVLAVFRGKRGRHARILSVARPARVFPFGPPWQTGRAAGTALADRGPRCRSSYLTGVLQGMDAPDAGLPLGFRGGRW